MGKESPLIPGIRSHYNNGLKFEEIWLEREQKGSEKSWLRCCTEGPAQNCNNVQVVPVDVQECIQHMHGKVATLFQKIWKRDDESGLYIPNTNGELSNEIAYPVGKRIRGKYLVWGKEVLEKDSGIEIEESFGNIHLVKNGGSWTDNQKSEKKIFGKGLHAKEAKNRIEKIEKELLAFESLLLHNFSNLGITRPGLPLALQNPFHFVRKNMQNPFKYYGAIVHAAWQRGEEPMVTAFSLRNPMHFSYAFKEDIDINDSYMMYAPLHRAVIMNAFQSGDNCIDAIGFMHEMVHCMHATTQRNRDYQAQFLFHIQENPTGNKKVVIQEEYDAYAVELEAFNIILNNRLNEAAKDGNMVDPTDIINKLGARSEQKMPITMLARLASIYFNSSHLEHYSPEYKDYVDRMTMFDGYDLYSPTYQLIKKCPENKQDLFK